MGALGAGDAKLLAATSLWVGPVDFLLFIYVLAAATVAVLLVVAFRTAWQAEQSAAATGGARALGAVAALRFVPLRKLTIPYGVAIAAGGVAVALVRLSALPL
jgi:prepilin peptidase CpaA